MFNGLKKAFTKGFNIQGSTDNYTPPKQYPWDWFQKDMPMVGGGDKNTTVEACVAIISQTVAMLDLNHIRYKKEGGYEKLQNSKVQRILNNPNQIQSKTLFWSNYVRSLLLEGNGYALLNGNKLFHVHHATPIIDNEYHDVYYSINNEHNQYSVESMIPKRFIMHSRLYTESHPLIGITPITKALYSIATTDSIQQHTKSFFDNMSRPSGVLTTDLILKKDQVKELRSAFNEVSKDLDTGGIPILTAGLKFDKVSLSATDAELVNTYKLNAVDIANVFRVPLLLLGLQESNTLSSSENIMRIWISSGLGFILRTLESELNILFNLPSNEKIEFDDNILLTPSYKDKIDGLAKAVQGGLMTINEARKNFSLEPKEDCDQPLVQMQMVEVSSTKKKMLAEIDALEASTEAVKNPPEAVEPMREPIPTEDKAEPKAEPKSSAKSIIKGLDKLRIM